MHFYYLLQDTPQYGKFRAAYDNLDKWRSNLGNLHDFLGCEPNGNIAVDANILKLASVPEHLKEQFKTKLTGNVFVAKVNSEIQKAWPKFCETLGLTSYQLSSVYEEIGWADGGPGIIRMFGKYYLESEIPMLEEWVEEIPASEYYTVRAEFAKALESHNSNQ